MNLILKLLNLLGYLITLVILAKMIKKAVIFFIARSRLINKVVNKAKRLFFGLRIQWQVLIQNRRSVIMHSAIFSPLKIVQKIGKGFSFLVLLVLSPLYIILFLLVVSMMCLLFRPYVGHDKGYMVIDI